MNCKEECPAYLVCFSPRLGNKCLQVLKRLKGKKKVYFRMDNIGKVKYTLNFYDGVKKNKDGSNFYDIRTFSNKKKMEKFEQELLKEGYTYEHRTTGSSGVDSSLYPS